MEYLLVQDTDCHWYVIPANREKDFNNWVNLPDFHKDCWNVPDYAKIIDGSPSLVKFKEYRIE